jgi:trehalose 6-phosphate phosphatase
MNGRQRRAARGLPPAPAAARDCAWFLDLDGTLIGFASSPAGVRIDRLLRELIEDLHSSAGRAVALITGRSIADVDSLFPDARLAVAGLHGIERRNASGRRRRHRFPTHRLDPVRRAFDAAAARHSRLLVEDKGASIALHYRRAPRLGGYVHRLARGMVAQLGTAYCQQAGKRVVEIRPAGRDKGIAIREFMREPPFRGRTPVFLGDDATDEYGFALVNRLGGYSVKVGPGRTVASWRLRDVRAVRAWLRLGLTAKAAP